MGGGGSVLFSLSLGSVTSPPVYTPMTPRRGYNNVPRTKRVILGATGVRNR